MLIFFRKSKFLISSFALMAFFISISSGLIAQDDLNSSEYGSVFEKISTMHLPSLAARERADELIRTKALTEKTTLSAIGGVEALKLVYSVFADNRLKESFGDYRPNQLIDDCVFKDLEIFCGDKDAENGLFSKIDCTKTPWGKAKLQSLFLRKFENLDEHINKIQEMQEKVKFLVENEELFKRIDAQLARLSDVSAEIMWMWKLFDEAGFSFWDRAFFHRHEHEILDTGKKVVADFTFMNESEHSLQLALFFMAFVAPLIVPIIGTGVSLYMHEKMKKAIFEDCNDVHWRIVEFVIAVMNKVQAGVYWDKWGNNAIICFYIVSCFLSIYMGFVNAQDMLVSANAVHKKMNNVVGFMESSAEISKTLKQSNLFDDLLKSSHSQGNKFISNKEIVEFNSLIETLLTSDICKKEPRLLSNRGKVLASFKKIMRMKSGLIGSFLMIGEIDMLMSMAKLYKQYQSHHKVRYCFAEFVTADKPYVNIQDFWHPFINDNDAVPNSIELGTQAAGRSVVLTGPNAAGKSSALKGLITAIILAHTLGIVPASKAVMTPFYKIDSHMNVTDEQGKESLFQAEMNRALKFLGNVKNLEKGQFMFTIFDELFSSTNPEEGMSGAYAIIKSLAQYPNCMSVLATHFKKLTDLEAHTRGFFKNYKVYVDVFEDGSFRRPFKFVPGISDQSMALLLMHKHGFDKQIVEDAFDVLSRLKGDKRSIIMPEGY